MKARKPTPSPGAKSRRPTLAKPAANVERLPDRREIAPGVTATRTATLRAPLELNADADCYVVYIQGDCLNPILREDDAVVVSPTAPLVRSEYVVMWPTEGRPVIKRLVSAPPWRPGPIHSNSNVVGLIECEMTNPPRRFSVSYEKLKAVHAVIGVMRDGKVIYTPQRPLERVTGGAA